MGKYLSKFLFALLTTLGFASYSQAAMFHDAVTGTIRSVGANTITLTATNNNQGDLTFDVDPSTKFEDVNAVTDLRTGDRVTIEYRDEQGRKLITDIKRTNSTANAYSTASPTASGTSANITGTSSNGMGDTGGANTGATTTYSTTR